MNRPSCWFRREARAAAVVAVMALASPLWASRAPAAVKPAFSFAAGDTVLGTDFNGDGKSDIAITGPNGWGSVPVAFSNGAGSFSVTNLAISNFASWAATSGAKVISGDFDGDGRTDLALIGPSGWSTIPVALSNGNGSFRVSNYAAPEFAAWAGTAGAQVLTGDFNNDGKTDLAITGPNGWGSVPVAFSNGDGSFRVTNNAIANFATWAGTAGAKVVVGDFNGDGKTDLAITGPNGWGSVPVAFSDGAGSFAVTNFAISNFASWAATSGAVIVGGTSQFGPY